MSASGWNGGKGYGGCLAVFAGLVAIAMVLTTLTSIAAIADPFGWLPPVDEIWEECQDDPDAVESECELAHRYPGFWGYVAVNLAYLAGSAAALVWLARRVGELRSARRARYDAADAPRRYERARRHLLAAATVVAGLAIVPVLGAVA